MPENKDQFKVYESGGEYYKIDPVDVDAFKADIPDAKELTGFVVGKDTFDIKTIVKQGKVADFVADFPDAKPMYGGAAAPTPSAASKVLPSYLTKKDGQISPAVPKPKTPPQTAEMPTLTGRRSRSAQAGTELAEKERIQKEAVVGNYDVFQKEAKDAMEKNRAIVESNIGNNISVLDKASKYPTSKFLQNIQPAGGFDLAAAAQMGETGRAAIKAEIERNTANAIAIKADVADKRSRAADAKRKLDELFMPIIDKAIAEGVDKFYKEETFQEGVKLADPNKVQAFVDKIIIDSGGTPGNFSRKYLYQNMIGKVDAAETIKKQTEIADKEFEKKYGIKPNEVYKVAEQAKIELDKSAASLMTTIEAEREVAINQVTAPIQKAIKDSETGLKQYYDQYTGAFQLLQAEVTAGRMPVDQAQAQLDQLNAQRAEREKVYQAEVDQYVQQYESAQKTINSKFSSRLTRQYAEIEQAAKDKLAKFYKEGGGLDPAILNDYKDMFERAGEATKKLQYIEATAAKSPIVLDVKELGMSLVNGFGNAIRTYAPSIGWEGGKILGEDMARTFAIVSPEIESGWDLLKPGKFASSAGFMIGNMGPQLIAQAALAKMTLGMSVFGRLAITGSVGLAMETTQIASAARSEEFARSGDAVKADKVAEIVISDNLKDWYLYTLDGLPFIKNIGFGIKGKGILPTLGRAGTRSGVEVFTESIQEIRQTGSEERARLTVVAPMEKEVRLASFSKIIRNNMYMDSNGKDLKSSQTPYTTFLNVLPSTMLMGGFGEVASYTTNKTAYAAGSVAALKNRFSEVSENFHAQYMYDMFLRKGENFTAGYITTLNRQGLISDQQFANITSQFEKLAEVRNIAARTKMSAGSSKVLFALQNDLDNKKSILDNAQTEVEREMAEVKYNAAKSNLSSFVSGKNPNYVVMQLRSGEQYVATYDEFEQLLNTPSFINDAKNNIRVAVIGNGKTTGGLNLSTELQKRLGIVTPTPEEQAAIQEQGTPLQEILGNTEQPYVNAMVESLDQRMANAEEIPTSDMNTALEGLYAQLDLVYNNHFDEPNGKAAAKIITDKIDQLQNYEFRTDKETQIIAETAAVQTARNAVEQELSTIQIAGRREQPGKPARRATVTLEDGTTGNYTIRVEDGNVTFNPPSGAPITMGDARSVNESMGFVESKMGANGMPTSVTFTMQGTAAERGRKTVTLSTANGYTQEELLDIAINLRAKEIGTVDPTAFDEAFRTVSLQEVEVTTFPNIQQDAIQEQAAGQVPVQPGTRGRQEVAQREPQAGPQEVTPAREGEAVTEGETERVAPPAGRQESEVEATAKALEEKFQNKDNDYFEIAESVMKDLNRNTSSQDVAEAYHKAKADGSNPKLVKAVEELLGKAERVAPAPTAGQRLLPVQVQERVDRIAQSIRGLGITVDVISDPTEWNNLLRRLNAPANTQGVFMDIDGKVYLNADQLVGPDGDILAFHEGTHPIVNVIRNTNKPLFDRLVNQARAAARADKTGTIGKIYTDAINQVRSSSFTPEQLAKVSIEDRINDEFVTELIASIAAGDIDINQIPRSLSDRVLEFVNEIAKLLGLKQITTVGSAEARRTMTQIANALRTGADITGITGQVSREAAMFTAGPQARAVDSRISEQGVDVSNKEKITQKVNPKKEEELFKKINDLIDQYPNALTDRNQWKELMSRVFSYRGPNGETLIPAFPEGLARMASSVKNTLDEIKKVSPEQRRLASSGLEGTKEIGRLYEEGKMDEVDTGLYFLWNILSIGQSPYPQEAGFLQAVNSGVDKYIKAASEGRFTDEMLNEYLQWVNNTLPLGSPGAGVKSNLNRFGTNFLSKASEVIQSGIYSGKTKLQALHDILADRKTPTNELRRRWHANMSGMSFNNKIFDFILLTTGRSDLFVIDRVRVDHFWDGKKLKEKSGLKPSTSLYDGSELTYGESTGAGISKMLSDVPGMIFAELSNRAMSGVVKKAYNMIGVDKYPDVGRFHWETWVAASSQEVSHGSIDAIVQRKRAGEITDAGIRQGKYGAWDFNFTYRKKSGQPFRYEFTDNDGNTYAFDDIRFIKEEIDNQSKKTYGNDETRFLLKNEKGDVIRRKTGDISSAWYDQPGVDSKKYFEFLRNNAKEVIQAPDVIEDEGVIIDKKEQTPPSAGYQSSAMERGGRESLPKTPEEFQRLENMGLSMGKANILDEWFKGLVLSDNATMMKVTEKAKPSTLMAIVNNYNLPVRPGEELTRLGALSLVRKEINKQKRQLSQTGTPQLSAMQRADRNTFRNNISSEIERIKASTEETGATVNLDGTPYTGGGLVVPAGSLNVPQGQISADGLFEFINQNSDKISSDIFKVGLYKFPDRPEVSYDLNIVIPNQYRDVAIEFGRLAGQESLFDLDTFENVKTGSDGKNPISFNADQLASIAQDLSTGTLPRAVTGQFSAMRRGDRGPLSSVEETTKALDPIVSDFLTSVGRGFGEGMTSNESRSAYAKMRHATNRLEKRLGFDIGALPSHTDRQKEIVKSLRFIIDSVVGRGREYDTIEELSQAYHQAKANGSNPELVKAVEDLLGGTQAQFSAMRRGDRVSGTYYEPHLTTDENGNYVFFHVSTAPERNILRGIDSRKFTSLRTSREEKGLQYGVASFYTKPDDGERMVGGDKYYVTVAPEKVYPMDADPNGYRTEAEKKVKPGTPFREEKIRKAVAEAAAKDGFEMAVGEWAYDATGMTSRELPAMRGDALTVLKPKIYTGDENFQTGMDRGINTPHPMQAFYRAKMAMNDIADSIKSELAKKGKYDEAYDIARSVADMGGIIENYGEPNESVRDLTADEFNTLYEAAGKANKAKLDEIRPAYLGMQGQASIGFTRRMATNERLLAILPGVNLMDLRGAIKKSPTSFYTPQKFSEIKDKLNTMSDAELLGEIDFKDSQSLLKIFTQTQGPISGLAFIEYINRMTAARDQALANNDQQLADAYEQNLKFAYETMEAFSTKVAQILRQLGEAKSALNPDKSAELYTDMLERLLYNKGVMISDQQRDDVLGYVKESLRTKDEYKALFSKISQDPNATQDDIDKLNIAQVNMAQAELALGMYVGFLSPRVMWNLISGWIKGNLVSLRTVFLGLISNYVSLKLIRMQNILMGIISDFAFVLNKAGVPTYGLEKYGLFTTARPSKSAAYVALPITLIYDGIKGLTKASIAIGRAMTGRESFSDYMARSPFASSTLNILKYGASAMDNSSIIEYDQASHPMWAAQRVIGRGPTMQITVGNQKLNVQRGFKIASFKAWLGTQLPPGTEFNELPADEKKRLKDAFIADQNAMMPNVSERFLNGTEAFFSWNAEMNFRLIAMSDVLPKEYIRRVEFDRLAGNMGLNDVQRQLFIKDPLTFLTSVQTNMSPEMVNWWMDNISEMTATKDTGIGMASMAAVNLVKQFPAKMAEKVFKGRQYDIPALRTIISAWATGVDTIVPFVRIPMNFTSFALDFVVPYKSLLKASYFAKLAHKARGTDAAEPYAMSSAKYVSRAVIGYALQNLAMQLLAIPGMVVAGSPKDDDDEEKKIAKDIPRNSINVDALWRYVKGDDPTYRKDDQFQSMNAFGVLGLMVYSYKGQMDSQRDRESQLLNRVPRNIQPEKALGVSEIIDATMSPMARSWDMSSGALPFFIDQSWFVGVSSAAQAVTDPKMGVDKFLSTWTGSVLAAWWGFSSHAQQLSDYYRELTGAPLSDIKLTGELKNIETEGYPTIFNEFMNRRFWNQVWAKNELIHKYMVDSQMDIEYISYGVYGRPISPVIGKKVSAISTAMSIMLPTRAAIPDMTDEMRFYFALYKNPTNMKVPGYTMSLAEPGLEKTATISIPGKDKDVLGKANDIPIIIPPKDYNTLVPMAGKITEKLHAKLLEPYMNMEVRGKKITPEMIMDPQFDNVKEIVEIRRGMGVAISEANRIVSSFLKPWELLQKDEIVNMLDMDTAAMIAKAVKDVESRVNIYKSYDVTAGRMDDFYVGVMIDETIAKDLSDLAAASIDMYVREAKKSIELEGEWDEYTKIETMTPEQERKMKEGYRRK